MSFQRLKAFFFAASALAVFLLMPGWNQAQSTDYYIPQVVDGGGYKMLFTVTNLSASTIAQFTIQVTADPGSVATILNIPGQSGGQSNGAITVQPGGQVTISTNGGSTLNIGWAKISSSSSIGVSAVFLLVNGGGLVTGAAGILPQPTQTTFTAVGLITAAARTGAAFLNISASQTANISFQLFNSSGTQVSTTKTMQVAPQRKVAQFFNEGSLFTDVTDFDGSVAISSDVPIQLLTLRLENTGQLSTLPNLLGRSGIPLQHADAMFNWIDATPSAGGSQVPLAGDIHTGDVNGAVAAVGMPFPITLFGKTFGNSLFEQLFISEDGWVSFGGGPAASPAPLPSANLPRDLVAGLFVDMHFSANNPGVGVFSRAVGTAPNRQFVIEWFNVSFVNSMLGTGTFEIIFYEGTSDIKMQYQSVGNSVSGLLSGGLVIGIQDDTRTQAVPVNVTANQPHANKAYTLQYLGGTNYTLIQN